MVTRILTTVGASMTVADYRNAAMAMNNVFPFQKAIGSLGGSVTKGVVCINNGIVTRIK